MLAKSLLSGSDAEIFKIFYSYSKKNSAFLTEFDEILFEFKWDVKCTKWNEGDNTKAKQTKQKPAQSLNLEPWYDRDIQPGEEWDKEIHKNLNAANIILLFITDDFLHSKYCCEIEMKIALERHEKGEARVIPIILEDTEKNWRKAPFAKLQCLPQNGIPVNRWDNKKDAFDHIVQRIVDIIVTQGINPLNRIRWRLHMEGAVKELEADEKLFIVEHLREISRDKSLRPEMASQGQTWKNGFAGSDLESRI